MKISKKYKVIAKINNEKFVKYNVNNLILFSEFLNEEFGGWRWFNVYDKKTKKQIGNFTKHNPPTRRFL